MGSASDMSDVGRWMRSPEGRREMGEVIVNLKGKIIKGVEFDNRTDAIYLTMVVGDCEIEFLYKGVDELREKYAEVLDREYGKDYPERKKPAQANERIDLSNGPEPGQESAYEDAVINAFIEPGQESVPSLPREKCPSCSGSGLWLKGDEPCLRCSGRGYVVMINNHLKDDSIKHVSAEEFKEAERIICANNAAWELKAMGIDVAIHEAKSKLQNPPKGQSHSVTSFCQCETCKHLRAEHGVAPEGPATSHCHGE